MNRRSSPNLSLMWLWWRTVRAIDVFPIPPGPMRAIGVRFPARLMIFSTNSSRPKHALGGGGGSSPGGVFRRGEIEDPMALAFDVVDVG